MSKGTCPHFGAYRLAGDTHRALLWRSWLLWTPITVSQPLGVQQKGHVPEEVALAVRSGDSVGTAEGEKR